MSVAVLYEDDAIIVVDKPAGLCVIPPRGVDARECLRHLVEARLGAKVWVVHRIDRDTSGVVVMAKTADAHRVLNDAFAARDVSKTYHALVSPAPEDDGGVVDVPLAPGRKGRMRPARENEAKLDARTSYAVLERYAAPASGAPATAALVAFEPVTGRQHQIRVHARFLGAPIVGDRLYAPRGDRESAPRLMLHAFRLKLRHPTSGEDAEFVAPHPADFEAVRQRLASI